MKNFLLALNFLILQIGISQPNDAQFITQYLPDRLIPGQAFSIQIIMQNTGNSIWRNTTEQHFRLVPISPKGNFLWGVEGIEIEGVNLVAPGQTIQFSGSINAPYAIGWHTFQWQMTLNGELFGIPSDPIDVFVGFEEEAPICQINRASLHEKVIFDYKACYGADKSTDNWYNYFKDPFGRQPKFDFWPDVKDYSSGALVNTGLQSGNDPRGNQLFESAQAAVIQKHFEWMSNYAIDGVFLDRLTPYLLTPGQKAERDRVLELVQLAALSYDRVFALKYSILKTDDTNLLEVIQKDWEEQVDGGLLESTSYLWHRGRPLVAIFGIGMGAADSQYAPSELLAFIEGLKAHPNPRYRATVIGFVPEDWNWRSASQDEVIAKEWQQVFGALDVVSPWLVGSFGTTQEADIYKALFLEPDSRYIHQMNTELGYDIDYMPVIWPGFSNGNKSVGEHTIIGGHNKVPRDNGAFIWHQLGIIKSLGVKSALISSFDNLNDGTAMFKLVAQSEALPALKEEELNMGYQMMALDVDGHQVGSDQYLKLSEMIGAVIRDNTPFGQTVLSASPEIVVDAGKDQNVCSENRVEFSTLNVPPAVGQTDLISWEYAGVGEFNDAEQLFPTYIPSSKEIGKTISFVLNAYRYGDCTPISDTLRLFVEQCTTTATNQEEHLNFTVYPNPYQTSFSVSNLDPWIGGALTICSVDGKVLEKHDIQTPQILNIGNSINPGMYLITLRQSRSVKVFRVVKTN